MSVSADLATLGAKSVPARLNLITSDDEEWEARTMMPGDMSIIRLATYVSLSQTCCLHCSIPAAWLHMTRGPLCMPAAVVLKRAQKHCVTAHHVRKPAYSAQSSRSATPKNLTRMMHNQCFK